MPSGNPYGREGKTKEFGLPDKELDALQRYHDFLASHGRILSPEQCTVVAEAEAVMETYKYMGRSGLELCESEAASVLDRLVKLPQLQNLIEQPGAVSL